MADDEPDNEPAAESQETDSQETEGEEKSFRERVKEIREERAQEREEGDGPDDPASAWERPWVAVAAPAAWAAVAATRSRR